MGEAIEGCKVIAGHARSLPLTPGVYRMIDADGQVLYVGKAKSLRKRVGSYTRIEALPARLRTMVQKTRAMEFILTETETEALLLEANLIKKLKPRYNVLLRDDKSFPYIQVVRTGAWAPRVIKYRGARVKGDDHFGPFASASAVNQTLDSLHRAFLLRTCPDSVFSNRTRPCLQFQIKRCSAPCTGEISRGDYARSVDEAVDCLKGRSRSVQKRLQAQMDEAAEALEFESAAILRDRLSALATILRQQHINTVHLRAADVFAIVRKGGRVCLQVFFYRSWQNLGNRAYFPRAEASIALPSVLGPFLAQFYIRRPVPRLILVNAPVEEQALLERSLSEKQGYRVRIVRPKRGEKKALLDLAANNAEVALARQVLDIQSSFTQQFKQLGALIHHPEPMRRVEIYDNSHHGGAQMLGVMVVAGVEGFAKQAYRRYNRRRGDVADADDYAMMREMLTRRFSRLVGDEAEAEIARAEGEDDGDEARLPKRPDLVIVDGGKGQLACAREVLETMNLAIPCLGIAKGRERNAGEETLYMDGVEPIKLEKDDPLLYFLQRLRDEAHRFAIRAQRRRSEAGSLRSQLDEIAGIGAARRRALLRHFGSVSGVKSASLAELRAVEGIDLRSAQAVFDRFHEV